MDFYVSINGDRLKSINLDYYTSLSVGNGKEAIVDFTKDDYIKTILNDSISKITNSKVNINYIEFINKTTYHDKVFMFVFHINSNIPPSINKHQIVAIDMLIEYLFYLFLIMRRN